MWDSLGRHGGGGNDDAVHGRGEPHGACAEGQRLRAGERGDQGDSWSAARARPGRAAGGG